MVKELKNPKPTVLGVSSLGDEDWEFIQGLPDYEVSSQGRVRTWRRRAPSKRHPHIRGPKIMDASFIKGYREVLLCPPNAPRIRRRVHQLVMDAFVGPNVDPNIHINHKNGVKHDNRVENLEYCTNLENRRHAYLMGLQKGRKGESNALAILTDPAVREIKSLLKSGKSHEQISKMFGVCRQAITNINRGKSWGHIPWPD